MDDQSPLYQYATPEVIGYVLEVMGIDLKDPNFQNTPNRWMKYIAHYTQPYDPKQDLGITFPPTGETTFENAMIVQVGIPYRAVCAHHLIPVLGTAHVGYIPRKSVVGLSKLSRLVYGHSHALPSLQEDVCNAITDSLMCSWG
jgi:GTP cyclohydrolase I